MCDNLKRLHGKLRGSNITRCMEHNAMQYLSLCTVSLVNAHLNFLSENFTMHFFYIIQYANTNHLFLKTKIQVLKINSMRINSWDHLWFFEKWAIFPLHLTFINIMWYNFAAVILQGSFLEFDYINLKNDKDWYVGVPNTYFKILHFL